MRRPARRPGQWRDHYTDKAKKNRYPARSVYKLKEIQSRYRLFRKGDRILDLGCYPGSWLLYAAELVGAKGRVLGIDLNPVAVKLPPQAEAMTGDILEMGGDFTNLGDRRFTGVISDMAPATTGIKHVDSARSHLLCETALYTAQAVLSSGGFFVCKIFQGSDFSDFTKSVRGSFKKHSIFKPKSSRKASKEIYIIGMDRIGSDTNTFSAL